MPSPVSLLLRDLRLKVGLTQIELAHSIGYEQAYVSSIELGTKNPSSEFLNKLAAAMNLSTQDYQELERALKASRRRFTLPPNSSTKTYMFCNELWDKLDGLHPALLEAMQVMLKIDEPVSSPSYEQPTRLRRRQKSEASM